MRLIVWLFVACLGIALLKLTIVTLVLALCIILVWAARNRPGEALAIASLITLGFLAERTPLVLILLIVGVLVACLIGKAIERSANPQKD